MKQIAFGMVAGMILILFLGIVVSIYGRTVRQNEAEQSLEHAMTHAMEQLKDNGEYAFSDTDDFVADFLEALLLQIDSDSDITVQVLAADEKKGVLSVEVVETYRHPTGGVGTVNVRRTMILDTAVKN